MTVDLLHNKIVKETVTEAFKNSVNGNLIPKLYNLYGVSLEGIQMYEDYIKDEFLKDGYWYYPLTVLLGEVKRTVWVKWDVSDKSLFKNGNPYAFLGEELDILLADDVPFAFKNALDGRSTYYEDKYLKVNVTTDAPDVTFLAGKYSQTFIDEMARQLTDAISKACGVTGIETSSIEVDMVFAPNTYMEHTSENVTYRRLLISAKGCAPRDFWIKWTRLNSSVAYSVNDAVDKSNIVFEIGEDVSHKTREKEYRFLVYGNSDKYRVAMGRKSITEWRELIKRSLKRGELVKSMGAIEEDTHVNEVSDKLSEILEKCGVTVPALDKTVSEESNSATDLANEALRLAVLGETEADDSEPENDGNEAETPVINEAVNEEVETEDTAEEKSFDDIAVPEFSFAEGLELTMSEGDDEDNFLLKNNTVSSDDEEYDLGIEESEGVSMVIEKPEAEETEQKAEEEVSCAPETAEAEETEEPAEEIGEEAEETAEESDEAEYTEDEATDIEEAEEAREEIEEVPDQAEETEDEDALGEEESVSATDLAELERLYTEIATLRRALEDEKIKSEKLEEELAAESFKAARLEEAALQNSSVAEMLAEAKAEAEAVKLEKNELERELELEKKHSEELLGAMETGAQAAEELADAKLQAEKERAARDGIEKQLEFERMNSADLRAQIEKDAAAIEEVRILVTEADNAKKLAEAEANRLRAENDALQRENRQLVEACRAAEEAADKAAEELREREQELLTQIELSEKERAREKQLFAEAARQAKEESERIAEQLAEEERERIAEEERLEKLRLEEEERIAKEEALMREKERLDREVRERAEENARRRAEAIARAQETRKRMEEAARRNAEARAVLNSDYATVSAEENPTPREESAPEVKVTEPVYEEVAETVTAPEVNEIPEDIAEDNNAEPEVTEAPVDNEAPSVCEEPEAPINAEPVSEAVAEAPKSVRYISKIARLMFRSSMDPNVLSRIHELVTEAITKAGKQDVYIKIKASTPDKTTVVLNFVQIPEDEYDLLVSIINYLGNSNLGIYKVVLA